MEGKKPSAPKTRAVVEQTKEEDSVPLATKRRASVRFHPTPQGSLKRLSSQRSVKRVRVRSSAAQRGSGVSGMSVDEWTVYEFPLPPDGKQARRSRGQDSLVDERDEKGWEEKRYSARVSSVDVLFFRPDGDGGARPASGFPQSPTPDRYLRHGKSLSDVGIDRSTHQMLKRRRSSPTLTVIDTEMRRTWDAPLDALKRRREASNDSSIDTVRHPRQSSALAWLC
jgi:hypothetical protein